ncbi:MAG: methylenetetrahydrofolate reductase [NAD(P)H] [Chloroflexi bacterium]|nr:methylenetetrahydrofolate reductase [NAD(P)H] [Chloroflexota bacterium]
MKISEILRRKRTISFEFYPPREEEGIPAVMRSMERLKEFSPDFVSVTYGAGGSTRRFTQDIAVKANEDPDVNVMAHITCAGQSRSQVNDALEDLRDAGIENVIALRGDPPRGETRFQTAPDGFSHATDLMEHIKSNFSFGIAGACYPEGHVESRDLETDIEHTKRKVDAGADFLISQLFYDNTHFYRFLERVDKAGINVPIIPGVLPFLSTGQIRRFTSLCGATIPTELDARLERLSDDDDAVRALGIEHATQQVRDLWDNGVSGVHFYALNRSYSISRILRNLSLKAER